MNDIKILHYKIKYQDSNIAVITFSKKEISDLFKNFSILTEIGKDPHFFWECFEDALFEIHGVAFAIIDGYEITITKYPELPNWGRIIENVIWSSLFFLNLGGGAVEVSKNGKTIGKVIKHMFDAVEPKYPRKK